MYLGNTCIVNSLFNYGKNLRNSSIGMETGFKPVWFLSIFFSYFLSFFLSFFIVPGFSISIFLFTGFYFLILSFFLFTSFSFFFLSFNCLLFYIFSFLLSEVSFILSFFLLFYFHDSENINEIGYTHFLPHDDPNFFETETNSSKRQKTKTIIISV